MADVNVGIGTTNPSQRLSVVGNVEVESSAGWSLRVKNEGIDAPGVGLMGFGNADGTRGMGFRQTAAGDLALDRHVFPNIGWAEALRVSRATGNVGIGTSSPAAKLDVEGVARLRYVIATPQDAGIEGGEVSLQGAPGFHSWQMDNYAGTFRLHTAGVSRFEVTNAGNVGIGTGAPSQKLEVVGNVRINGGFVATGPKSAAVTLPDNREVLLYAVESTGNWFEDFGHAALSNGAARVELDPTFAQTVNTEMTYHVFLTPNGNCNGLYVARKTATGFEVRELGGGQTNVAFDYRIVARRKGYENVTSQAR